MRLPGVVVGAVGLALAAACSLVVDTSGLSSSDASDASTTPDAPAAEPLPCDPSELPRDGVFASERGDDTAAGTRDLPVKTIAKALALATSQMKSLVYLEEGTYREAVILSSAQAGVTLSAGWLRSTGTWTHDCNDNVVGRTTIASPGPVGLRISGASREVVLERLTIATEPAGASLPEQSGESIFGLFVEASIVRLRGVVIAAGTGGAGGFVPDRPAAPNQPCDGIASCGAGQPGAAVPQATPATASGTFEASGYLPSDGASGAPGLPGSNGTTGGNTPTPCGGCGAGSMCVAANNCLSMPAGGFVAGRGRCGCGGAGGSPGGPGRGGGASVAIFMVGGEITLEYATVRAGAGGNGSTGGGGGAGGPGTPGLMGDAAGLVCPVGCNPMPAVGAACNCAPTPTPVAGGAAGGAGGAGSAGAKGGGGAGGPSHAVVTSNGARLTRDSKSILAPAAAGKGAGGAADGVSSDTRAL